jgi:two-component system OmpR family response regulator/two-component system response regulator QseB
LIDIAQKEFEVLNYLMNHIGQVISRAKLEESLYAWGSEVESNAVEVHIHHLRKKIDSNLIRTIRGVGYIIDHQ